MEFSGIEKLSLVDYDNKLSCILFFAGCNFRCPFCQNGGLVLKPIEQPIIPFEQILDYLKERKNVLDAVVISGGEPTLMPDLKEKIIKIKKLGYLVKLDTNGTHPEIVKDLYNNGLIDYVAMDIKNSEDKYSLTIRAENLHIEKIKETIDFLKRSGIGYEFRTTMMLEFHDMKSMEGIEKLIGNANKLFLQKYIDSDNCIAHGFHAVPEEEAIKFRDYLRKFVKQVDLRGY
ncbi:MAG: anaerobic ribonucleoside-triphosphate reductase activating protein [Erysipelotrichaceae bacterium]|jgi:pyruvate formate lyase activating enzyme|nr:anaerobic ribonucleoside-triphosphate reductase activating protein [Erysipelotrichaceae bacterium]MCB9499806.1 anaerobic ribonucleoside-triphosphate reductase activating protein [Erysipelotrichaceae bacterium]